MHLLGIFTFCAAFAFSNNSEQVFTEIYEKGSWGFNDEGKGFSGFGSTLSNTTAYIAFLQDFIEVNQIKTIVDAGCGDWTFSKNIQWGTVQYLGIDVVKSVIEEDITKYGSENIHFKHVDILNDELPAADLLICKDVLMHLSNDDVIAFLMKTEKYKHCLFINNLDFENPSNVNHEIMRGGFRPLDLIEPPFNLNGIKIFTYYTDHAPKQVVYCGHQRI